MQGAATSHIWLDECGRAWIDDTNVKVIELVRDLRAYGSTAEEMHEQYPHLSQAQVHASLAYYYDHKPEFDAEIERELQELDELAVKANATSPFRQRMRALGNLP
jgi:uncharacterized protein (DUF433 family)